MAPPPARQHAPGRLLRHQEPAVRADHQGLADLLRVELDQWTADPIARVVVHDVERAELLVGLGEQALDLIGQGDVAAEDEAVDLGAEGLELLRPAGGEPHLDPVPRQEPGEGRADAFTHPDDQCRPGHVRPLPRRASRRPPGLPRAGSNATPDRLAPDALPSRPDGAKSSPSGGTAFRGTQTRRETQGAPRSLLTELLLLGRQLFLRMVHATLGLRAAELRAVNGFPGSHGPWARLDGKG